MSSDISTRMLWHDTNYCGKYIRGIVLHREWWDLYPVALRSTRLLVLDYGDPAKIPRPKDNRIPLKEHHFLMQKPHDIIWDLYFVRLLGNCAQIVLVPREVFDSPKNGVTLHAEALYRLSWQYMGSLDSSTFRWDLHLELQRFFGSSHYPHCRIEAFLPGLAKQRAQGDGKSVPETGSLEIDKDRKIRTAQSNDIVEVRGGWEEPGTMREGGRNNEFVSSVPQRSPEIEQPIPKQPYKVGIKSGQKRGEIFVGKLQKNNTTTTAAIKSIPKENEQSRMVERTRRGDCSRDEKQERILLDNSKKKRKPRNKTRGRGIKGEGKKPPLVNSSNA